MYLPICRTKHFWFTRLTRLWNQWRMYIALNDYLSTKLNNQRVRLTSVVVEGVALQHFYVLYTLFGIDLAIFLLETVLIIRDKLNSPRYRGGLKRPLPGQALLKISHALELTAVCRFTLSIWNVTEWIHRIYRKVEFSTIVYFGFKISYTFNTLSLFFRLLFLFPSFFPFFYHSIHDQHIHHFENKTNIL